jgi:hypothetical protein
MIQTIVTAILFGCGVVLPYLSAEAETQPDPQKLTQWFCSISDGPLDFPKLVDSFPFDKLGKVTTTRAPVAATAAGTESSSTSVDQEAKSERFIVIYHYQYNNSDVSSPFGFMLQVRQITIDFSQDPDAFAKSWLNSLGKPEFQMYPIVGLGTKNQYTGYTAYFSYWPNLGAMSMNWFQRTDISSFSSICKPH